MSSKEKATPKREEPTEESLRMVYAQTVRFIESTENGRIRLLQVYIMVLTAFITGSAMIVAYGYGKIEPTILSLPLTIILGFLAFLSSTLYHIFLRWDAAYAYDMAVLEWISEKLKMARNMSDDSRKDLYDRYEKLNKKYARFLMIPLPKRGGIPDWAMIDEVYGPLSPPSSIRAHPSFTWLLVICTGSSLSLSIFLALYSAFHLPIGTMIILGVPTFFVIHAILFGYDIKLRKKIEEEVDLFKEFRKPKDVKISGLEHKKPEEHYSYRGSSK